MYLIHKLKGTQHKIPLDADRAVQPESFATYTEEAGEVKRARCAGWRFFSMQEGKEKYTGHSFELCVEPHEIDAAIHALQVAKERFNA